MADLRTFWRRVLIYTHRWLGIGGSLLFVVWFVSGIVLMYAGMPVLSPEERLSRLPRLDLTRARVSVGEAASRGGVAPGQVRIGMVGDRPVYRFAGSGGWTTVYADTGNALSEFTEDDAMAVVRGFVPEYATTAHYDALLTEPDQWTLQDRSLLPVHRVQLGDEAASVIYVSTRTAEPVMQTSRRSRRWAYLGAVLHWLYFTPLRVHTTLWIDVVIWLSILGCVLCLSGLVWGLWRLSMTTVYRLRSGTSHSPYAGLMRWHHYGGLVFGLFTFTWVFSGGLSLDPWDWHPPTTPTQVQRQAVTGGTLRLGPLTVPQLRAAQEVIEETFPVRELEALQFRGEPYLMAHNPVAGPDESTALPTTLASLSTQAVDQRLVSALQPERGAFTRFSNDQFDEVVVAAMPGSSVVDATWLRGYDAYYYDRDRRQRLPVLRVRYDDPVRTWLYFDPYRGAIVRKEERLTRLNRWLYHGLHSLDFAWLYAQRPLWDIVVILLSLGGIFVSVTSLAQGWRRLRRHAVRTRRRAPTLPVS